MTVGGAPAGRPLPPSPLAVDSLSMWETVAALPEQIAAAADLGAPAGLPASGVVAGVVVHALDEGGVAADLAAAVAAAAAPVPVLATRSFRPPACCGQGWLLLAVSWSGDDEESLAAADAAAAAGAVVAVATAGGALGRLAAARGWPVAVPPPGAGGAWPSPAVPGTRASLAALTVPPLLVLEATGVLDGVSGRLSAAAGYLATRRDAVAAPGGVAGAVARRVGRTVPLVHGPDGPPGVAAQRWKAAFNLNAKSPAFSARHPALCHDEVAGWGLGGDVTRQVLTLVSLRHAGEDPRLARRADQVEELLAEVVGDVVPVRSEATDDLACFYELALVGELASLHRAGQEGVDPGPVPALGEVAPPAGAAGGAGAVAGPEARKEAAR